MHFYDFPEVYDLFYSKEFEEECLSFYKHLFSKKKFQDVLDCSVGTGKMLIPMAKMGFSCTGTDINQKMVQKAKQNFARENLLANLQVCDYKDLKSKVNREYDCVMCTGNSLAHANNDELSLVIQQMNAVLKPGGTLYIDSRNWDNILKRKQRFYLFNPIIRDKGRVNYVQVWDYLKNGSIMFNYLVFEEIDNKIVSKRQFYEIYYPFSVEKVKLILTTLNYQNIKVVKLGDPNHDDIEHIDWYALTAEKPIEEVFSDKRNRR